MDIRECSLRNPDPRMTVIHPDASFDASAHHLSGHAEGLRMNDPVTLASLFEILTHVDNCRDNACQRCYPDGDPIALDRWSYGTEQYEPYDPDDTATHPIDCACFLCIPGA